MNIKNDKGITLIILVVTLVVMAILSTIFIVNTINTGTIDKAENIVNLNNDLINKTKDSEKNLLIRNLVEFKAEDETKKNSVN